MSGHPDCGLFHAIMRGNWDFSSDCNIFSYLGDSVPVIAVGGKALGGWPNCRVIVHSPRCCFRNSTNNQQIDNFIAQLFPLGSIAAFKKNGPCHPLKDVMLASQLQYLQIMIDKYSNNHIAVTHIRDIARNHNIPFSTLKEWGREVDADMKHRNARQQAGDGPGGNMIRAYIDEQRNELKEVKSTLHTVVCYLQRAEEKVCIIKC